MWTSERIAAWQETGIRPSVAVWTAAQTAAFLNAVRGHWLYAAFHLIALRGLLPLPVEPFDTAAVLWPRVDR